MISATTTITYYPTYVEVDGGDPAPLDDIEVDTAGATSVPAFITYGKAEAAGTATVAVGFDHRPEVGWHVRDETTGDTYLVETVQRAGPLLPGWVAGLALIP